MRFEGGATTISWIPSEAITGIVYRLPFDVSIAHYDDAPPDVLPELDAYLAQDRARFANQLHAWIDVEDGKIVDHGSSGGGRLGSTTLRLGGRRLSFMAFALPDIVRATRVGDDAVRFEQTAGGRTGVPAPRRVASAPYAQFVAPLAWTTIAVTLRADGSCVPELAGASPFPRHFLYGPDGRLTHKSALIEYQRWSTTAFGQHSPWGDVDSPAVVHEVETSLERELSALIMKSGRRPELRRLKAGERLLTQHENGTDLYLVLDGVMRVTVDGLVVGEVGPGAILGERALLESGSRTATIDAATACLIAVAPPDAVDHAALKQLAQGHRREAEPEAISTPDDQGGNDQMSGKYVINSLDDGTFTFDLRREDDSVIFTSQPFARHTDVSEAILGTQAEAGEAALPPDLDTTMLHMH